MIRRGSYYGIYSGKECAIGTTLENLVSYNESDVSIGFIKKKVGEETYYIKPIIIEEIESAYKLETWAEVDGVKMKIWNYKEGKYTFYPENEEIGRRFNVKYRGWSGDYEAIIKSEDEIDSIWEVRSPIEGFPFNTEEVVYLKMYGEWLEDKNE